MAFTNDQTFTGKMRPFSEEFANKLRGVAADLSAINSMLPSLQYALQLVDPSGSGGSAVFPAKITGGSHPSYTWWETQGPDTDELKLDGKNSEDLGTAVNTLEVGLVPGQFIPPGLSGQCMADLEASGGVEPQDVRGVVMMALGTNSQTDEPQYYFSCPVSVCPNCTPEGTLRSDVESMKTDPEFTAETGQIFADGKAASENASKLRKAAQDRLDRGMSY